MLEMLYSITTKMTYITYSESLQKPTYKTFKQVYYISNCFRVIRCQKRVFTNYPVLIATFWSNFHI
jgi:hypothetical protein